jgi:pyruvate/2-oxoglutarate/acetoin dehydrogenase E1 component
MMRVKLWKAINTALAEAMREDERVVVFGQDVAGPGGPFGMTRGLLEEFGPLRIRDAPISEAALVACGTGAAMMGLHPVVEIMYLDFLTLGMDQLVNQAAKYLFFNLDVAALPLVIHTLYGGRANYGAQHSQSLEAWLCHVPGLKVGFPSTPQDAYEVLRAAIADEGPVVVIQSIALLRQEGDLDTGSKTDWGIGRARLVRQGNQLTVVSYGPAMQVCQEAIAAVGVDADLIDLRWLQPWDEQLVRASVQKTARLLVVHDAVEPGGWGAELVARIAAEEFWALDAPPLRIGAHASPIPIARRDWSQVLPNVERVAAGIRHVLEI